MTIVLATPDLPGLTAATAALATWQHEGAPMQLHPGDLGWAWRLGAEALTGDTRTWSRDGQVVAVGVLDDHALVRMTLAPDLYDDEELAQQLFGDLTDPSRGVLDAGRVAAELPRGALVRELIRTHGWGEDAPWQPLRLDLGDPLPDAGVRVEVVGPEQVDDRVAVQRGAFDNSTFTSERWHTMAAGPAYATARCLVAYDEDDNAVAGVTVWSAGPGRPGLLEPMGVHRDHRGRGFGKAINRAAAAALQDLGSSSAWVCTPSSNVGGVAGYVASGFAPLPEVRDVHRDA
ncbi:MAG: hypothetical protein JWO12_1396 [Frankiales bacterium]|nr:hypothetical protein [Frankiales bacterium]